MLLPKQKEMVEWSNDLIDKCRASQAKRASMYRVLNQWIETGKATGNRGLLNKLYAHTDKLSSHLFSPTDLRFSIDFEGHYDDATLAHGQMAARVLTREWKRKDFDMNFARGVNTAVNFGACIMKQMFGHRGPTSTLVMPWQFAVYREDMNGLDEQEAMVETSYMTMPEVWRRIKHMDKAEDIFKRIAASAAAGAGTDAPNSFFHTVLSTATLNTNQDSSASRQPGGMVQLTSDPSMQIMGPEVMAETVQYHELWVVDDDLGDYTTVQLIEPDILITPSLRRKNLFVPKSHPYTLIQPNVSEGFFWGRSEITDLMEPQDLLDTWINDIRRVMGSQYDKLLAFSGQDQITDENYAQFRNSGYLNLGAGGGATDVTPKLPEGALAVLEFLLKQMEEISGFGGVLSGQGESGVRAGVHADTLMRTGSPRLRDRSLLVERQCADAANKTLDLMQMTDDRVYKCKVGDKQMTEFLLHDLPDDLEVMVDSHSGSPVYEQDHKDLISFGLKMKIVDGESAIEMLPFPKKDVLIDRYRKGKEAEAQMMREHPELAAQHHKNKDK